MVEDTAAPPGGEKNEHCRYLYKEPGKKVGEANKVVLTENCWIVRNVKVVLPTKEKPYEVQEGDEIMPFNNEEQINSALKRFKA